MATIGSNEILVAQKIMSHQCQIRPPQGSVDISFALYKTAELQLIRTLLNGHRFVTNKMIVIPIESSESRVTQELLDWASLGVQSKVLKVDELSDANPDKLDVFIINVDSDFQEGQFVKAIPKGKRVYLYQIYFEPRDIHFIWTLMHPWWKDFVIDAYETIQTDDGIVFIVSGTKR